MENMEIAPFTVTYDIDGNATIYTEGWKHLILNRAHLRITLENADADAALIASYHNEGREVL